jgi:hypothetical protein|tara:strand:+ start:234 stop:989 length:756 start_codon:yes stop_codon:yes gene_type:complete
MATAKDIRLAPIRAKDANRIIKKLHYSGKVAPNSQLHIGVFLDDILEGALQFGPSINKRGTIKLVAGTGWNEFIELNRLAFSDKLPRNSESRALSIALKIIRKQYPHIKWVVSFADGTQCGDGAIYRASGFVLTAIKKNTTVLRSPDGRVVQSMAVYHQPGLDMSDAVKLPGFMLRYVYFLDKSAKANLAVPILPFSKIDEMGASMYLGKSREKQAMDSFPESQRRGSTDLHAPNLEGSGETFSPLIVNVS